MKFSVLIVCVLNVLVFFWELHNGAFKPQLQQPANLPTILLAEEAERAHRGAQISTYIESDAQAIERQELGSTVMPLVEQSEPVKAVASQTQACYEFGPFASRKAANAWLAAQGVSGRLFYKSELAPTTFMLYAPVEKDPQKRRLYKQMLIDKGVKDFYIFANGELKGYMSFGVFNDQPHASRYQQQLAERGVQVQIKERSFTRNSLFVSFSSPQGGDKVAAGVLEVSCKE